MNCRQIDYFVRILLFFTYNTLQQKYNAVKRVLEKTSGKCYTIPRTKEALHENRYYPEPFSI